MKNIYMNGFQAYLVDIIIFAVFSGKITLNVRCFFKKEQGIKASTRNEPNEGVFFTVCREDVNSDIMKIKQAQFIISNTDYKKCPETKLPEFAFIGRSNVGKSSLINMLCNNQKLAKVSGRPGKTQLINHFLIDEKWYLVDLPGYGYAKVSKKSKAEWGKMVQDYLLNRENLQCVFVLIDSRLDPQKIDLEFIGWLGDNGVPMTLVFTKADKLSKNKVQASVAKFKKTFLSEWEVLPPYFITSAETKRGQEELLEFIDDLVKTQ